MQSGHILRFYGTYNYQLYKILFYDFNGIIKTEELFKNFLFVYSLRDFMWSQMRRSGQNLVFKELTDIERSTRLRSEFRPLPRDQSCSLVQHRQGIAGNGSLSS